MTSRRIRLKTEGWNSLNFRVMRNIHYLRGAIVTLCIMFAIPHPLTGQSTPEAFLGLLPGIPSSVCTNDESEVNAFSDQIILVKEKIKEYSDRVSLTSGKSEKSAEKEAYASASSMTGISQAELKRLAGMSEAEQERWAQEYAAKQAATAKAGKPVAGENSDKAKRLYSLNQERARVKGEIDAIYNRLKVLNQEMVARDTIETRKKNSKIKTIEKAWADAPWPPRALMQDPAVDLKFKKQIYQCESDYCSTMSPLMLDYVTKYLTGLKYAIPLYRKLCEVDNEISTIQGLTTAVIKDENLYAVAAVEDYTDVLSNAYMYRCGKFEE